MVASYTQLLADRYKGRLDERADRYIHYVWDGARRMQGLIRDLLAYSRLSAREGILRDVDSAAVVQTVLDQLAKRVEETGATITLGPLPVVRSVESELGQVFQNLIANALKFRAAAAPAIHIEAGLDGAFWAFMVRDNGIGIDPRFHHRIFQMFQRLHEREKYEGSGIGLAIARKIIEQQGGRIWVESTPDLGSVFRFTLPRSPGEPA